MNIVNCLIVDDEPIARDIIKAYCTHLPALNVVASCENAFDARLELQRQRIDIIFLDINMPRLSGMETLQLIRKEERLRNIPIVIYSTTDNPAEIMQCLINGASEFLRKPNTFEDLCRSLKPLLSANQNGSKRSCA